MTLRWKLGILAGLIIAASGILGWKARTEWDSGPLRGPGSALPQTSTRAADGRALPTLVDLGRDTCQPCRRMVPILRELEVEYSGRVVVSMVDLDEDPSAAERFGVYLIPTQVFLDEDGNEVYRHVGYMPKEDIVAVLKDMGVD